VLVILFIVGDIQIKLFKAGEEFETYLKKFGRNPDFINHVAKYLPEYKPGEECDSQKLLGHSIMSYQEWVEKNIHMFM